MKNIHLALFALSILIASSLLSSTSISDSTLLHAPRIRAVDVKGASLNWAGYAVETNLNSPQSNAVSDVKGSWTVPQVNCKSTPNAYSSFWIGIDGYSSGTVEQTGTDSDCSSGSARYYAWYEMYPKFPTNLKMTVTPGDTMTAEVQYRNGKFQITISDFNPTTGKTQFFATTQKSPNAQRSSAEWIAEAPSSSGGVLPLANFGTVTFSSAQATLNGHTGTISDSAWQNDAIKMVTSSGTVKAQPSSLSNSGSSFSVTWQHS